MLTKPYFIKWFRKTVQRNSEDCSEPFTVLVHAAWPSTANHVSEVILSVAVSVWRSRGAEACVGCDCCVDEQRQESDQEQEEVFHEEEWLLEVKIKNLNTHQTKFTKKCNLINMQFIYTGKKEITHCASKRWRRRQMKIWWKQNHFLELYNRKKELVTKGFAILINKPCQYSF